MEPHYNVLKMVYGSAELLNKLFNFTIDKIICAHLDCTKNSNQSEFGDREIIAILKNKRVFPVLMASLIDLYFGNVG